MSAPRPTVIVRRARAEDRAAVERLLVAAELPLAGVAEHFEHFLVAVSASGVIGAIGLERYGDDALLRSAVVAPDVRDRGVGALLAMRLIEGARSAGVKRLYLLTTSAETWFERAGFRRVGRDAIPEALNASAELGGACPESAVSMMLPLA